MNNVDMDIRYYSHYCKEQDWNQKEVASVVEALRQIDIRFDTKLRRTILDILYTQGWSSQVKLTYDSGISITATNNNFGLCLQTGNMSRFYADLLKLQYLFLKKTISAAIYIVPTKRSAKLMGSNLVNFERLTEELALFSDIITIPIFVIGIN